MLSPPAALWGDTAYLPLKLQCDGGEDLSAGKGNDTPEVVRILRRNFGKIALPNLAVDTSQPIGPSTQVRYLQLSLEEAFYLKYVDECLTLTLQPPRFFAWTEGKRSGQCQEGGDSTTLDDDQAQASGDASLLGCKEAWEYCCARQPSFPSTFAVFQHFRCRGYTVHSGQMYGAHFVLYEGSPDLYHSRYCVHIMDAGGGDSWGHIKNMTRLMPDIAKCLLVCSVSYLPKASSPPSDTSMLQALARARVSTLAVSPASEKEATRGRAAAAGLPGNKHARLKTQKSERKSYARTAPTAEGTEGSLS
ncbi:unnamed protein product [Discosporangium mesarthrocarpum]